MFSKLLEIIQDNSAGDFDTLLTNASMEDFLAEDPTFGGTLIHWAALKNQETILISIYNFLEQHKKNLKLFLAISCLVYIFANER